MEQNKEVSPIEMAKINSELHENHSRQCYKREARMKSLDVLQAVYTTDDKTYKAEIEEQLHHAEQVYKYLMSIEA